LSYVFLQCINEECRFRFPAPAGETAAALICPRCHSALTLVAEAERRAADTTQHPTGDPEVVGLLDNIRSIHNVGSMFRSADGAGAAHLHLAGITATPHHPRLAKAALGAHQTVPWTYQANGIDVALGLKAAGFRLWALERTGGEQPSLFDLLAPGAPLVVVVGHEKAGIDPGILALCDAVVSLPMAGNKSSLNAAVAFGIALYHLRFGAKREIEIDTDSKGLKSV